MPRSTLTSPTPAIPEGMTVYYVTSYADGVAYIYPIEGTVPKGTPVIIKCSSPFTAGNKLDLGGEAAPISYNKLKGVYFNNTSLLHKNLTPMTRRPCECSANSPTARSVS